MKNSKDNSTIFIIIISVILIVFAIFIILNIFSSSKEVRSNTTPNVNNSNNTSLPKANNIVTQDSNSQTRVTSKLTKEEFEIATYTTKIYDNDENRIYNIKLACENLNGHHIKEGEEFSFNGKMGNMGPNEGYKKATGFDGNGRIIKVYAGGMCQISSTLYNSALIAGLEITERHAHSRRVTYVPKDKDATVFAGGPDLKFINNTKEDIIIYASTDGYEVTISIKKETIVES